MAHKEIQILKVEGVTLRRMIRRLPDDIIVWEVISEDGKIRYGIILQKQSLYLSKRIGWKDYYVKYWMGNRFFDNEIFVAKTRKEIIKLVSTYVHQSHSPM